MYSSNRPLWALVGLPLLGLLAFTLFGESDRDKFNRLEVGMSARAVQSIMYPRTGGKYASRVRNEIRDNETLTYKGIMVLTIRNGVLVEKRWIGPESP